MAQAKTVKKTVKAKAETKSKTVKTVKKVTKGGKDGVIKESVAVASEASLEEEKLVELEQASVDNPKEQSAPAAKAGKRSAKALKEDEEKQAKEERKTEAKLKDEEPKVVPTQKPRTADDRLKTRSKNYQRVYKLVDQTKTYGLGEALDLATKTSPVKFDAAIEMHIRLNVDPKQADQNIRSTIVLPAGNGKNVRIAVFADAVGAKEAQKAGADIAAADEFLQQLDKGTLDFDVLISTPANMPKLGKYARLLGPKGLMPNPKSGTVTNDLVKAVAEAKAGKVEYRVDSTGIVHLGIGKVSFGAAKLLTNAQAVLASIKGSKPASVKSTYVRSIYVTSSMGPSIVVDNQAGQ